MTVTELAILPLIDPTNSFPGALIDKLKTARTVLETASGHKFYYFQQIEDPSFIYLLGRWDSVATHQEFLPSVENQKLLELLKHEISINGIRMWHLDADIFTPAEMTQLVLEAPTISCNRHFVSAGKKEDFEQQFQEVKSILDEYTKPYSAIGGWRIEKETNEKEEWVLFSGFESVDHHTAFAKTDGFAEYKKIVGFVEGFELKHLKRIEGL